MGALGEALVKQLPARRRGPRSGAGPDRPTCGPGGRHEAGAVGGFGRRLIECQRLTRFTSVQRPDWLAGAGAGRAGPGDTYFYKRPRAVWGSAAQLAR